MITSSVLATPPRGGSAGSADPALGLPAHGAIRRHLAELLGDVSGRRILDAGCGTGEDALELSALVGPTGKVIGTDIEAGTLSEGRRRSTGSGLPIEFQHRNACEMDYPDGYFDAVRAKELLSHCSRADEAAAELLRVTKPGGRLAVFEYDPDTVTVDHPDIAATRRIVHYCSDSTANRWSGRQLARRFLDLGLNRVTVTPHTTVMPLAYFRDWLRERIRQAEGRGQQSTVTAAELAQWWRPLENAAGRDRFFASITGFALGGTA